MTTINREPEVVRGYRSPYSRPSQPTSPRADSLDHREPPSSWRQRITGPQLPGFVSGATLLSGLWLLVAPAALNYGDTGGGFDARWNDTLVGLVIAVVGVARLAGAIRLGPATMLALTSGAWLIIAPFVLAYGLASNSTRATVSDVLIGLLIVVATIVGHASARMSVATRI